MKRLRLGRLAVAWAHGGLTILAGFDTGIFVHPPQVDPSKVLGIWVLVTLATLLALWASSVDI